MDARDTIINHTASADPSAHGSTERAHPKALLLLRASPAQFFCANTLFRHGVIDTVYLEQGVTGEPDKWEFVRRLWKYGIAGIWQRLLRDARHFQHDYRTLLHYYVVRFQTASLMNRQAAHNARLLGDAHARLDAGLRVVCGPSINDRACQQLVREGGHRVVFVFGTGLLRDELLSSPGVVFVNMHHGWLPRFRGEGILSALAEEGIGSLGVSVHLIDRGIDTGPIIYRERPLVEPGDNVYAISLKSTILGTQLFLKIYDDLRQGELRTMPQRQEDGTLYRSRDLKTRYGMRKTVQRVLAKAGRSVRGAETRHTRIARHLKTSLAVGGVIIGATAMARKRHGAQVRILMYHGVVPRLEGPAAFGDLFLSAGAFARQMRHLRRAFAVLSLDEAIDRLERRAPIPERAVVVTFDDGYRNTLTTALPIAQAAGVPVMVFVPSEQVNQERGLWFDILRVLVNECARQQQRVQLVNSLSIDGRLIKRPEDTFLNLSQRIADLPHDQVEPIVAQLEAMERDTHLLERYPEFAIAGWEEWHAAVRGGHLTVGSHGLTHRNFSQMSPEERDAALRRSKQQIEQALSRPCQAVAYPCGAWNEEVAQAAARAGYRCALTTDDGLNGPQRNLFKLHRTMIGDKGNFAMFCARVSGLRNWVRSHGP
ncbi:MAG: hypothetical protein COV75_07855 [Candidatus Omnitrophica bacterium CG11_big_fil_rev_8_21_14_0_20_63_9]|nr:MAG: hypothetical protein COV75_07855 [Candidatus Omnitrophica bacterium CG11_big_fil_rev_8_21_14_0_20_63_9]